MLKSESFKIRYLRLLAISFMAFFSLTLSAQCKFFDKKSNPETTGIEMPCNFPIYVNTGNFETDSKKFDAEVAAFKAANPLLINAIFRPVESPISPDVYIEISQAAFDALPPEKKVTVQSIPAFYHIK